MHLFLNFQVFRCFQEMSLLYFTENQNAEASQYDIYIYVAL